MCDRMIIPRKLLSQYNILNNNYEDRVTPDSNHYQWELYNTIFDSSYDEKQSLFKPLKDKKPYSTKNVAFNTKHMSNVPDIAAYIPGYEEDFYKNIIQWKENRYVYVASGNELHIINVETLERDIGDTALIDITCLAMNPSYTKMALFSPKEIESADFTMQLIDIETGNLIVTRINSPFITNHNSKTYSCLWINDNCCYYPFNGRLYLYDDRSNVHSNIISIYSGLIPSMKASLFDDTIAIGTNDNNIMIYDIKKGIIRTTLEGHSACIKGLQYNQNKRNELVSGGGRDDETMMFWNVDKEKITLKTDKIAQFTSINWLKRDIIITTHGYKSGSIFFWYPKRKTPFFCLYQKKDNRILESKISPKEDKLCCVDGLGFVTIWNIDSIYNGDCMQSTYSLHHKNNKIR